MQGSRAWCKIDCCLYCVNCSEELSARHRCPYCAKYILNHCPTHVNAILKYFLSFLVQLQEQFVVFWINSETKQLSFALKLPNAVFTKCLRRYIFHVIIWKRAAHCGNYRETLAVHLANHKYSIDKFASFIIHSIAL